MNRNIQLIMACPAVILAASLKLKVDGHIMILIYSVRTRNGLIIFIYLFILFIIEIVHGALPERG